MTADEIQAAVEAIGLECQRNAHGAGRYSIEIFHGRELVARYQSSSAMAGVVWYDDVREGDIAALAV